MRFASSLLIATLTVVSSASMAASIATPLAGCSSSDSAACTDYDAPASENLQAPLVSFSKDVFPIFGQSCAFTSCHGATSGSSNGIFLGGADPVKVHDALVDVHSDELVSMAYVTANAPHDSYLMRKLDGSQCVLNAQCTGGDCGESMPRDTDALPLDTRDIIRRWISQGAKND